MSRILVKTDFATLAGVSPAAITKAAKAGLKPAMVGKRIDAAHPVAVAYIEKQQRKATPAPAPGIDPLYSQAVAACQLADCMTVQYVQSALGIGQERAQKIIAQMKAADTTPKPTTTKKALEKFKELTTPNAALKSSPQKKPQDEIILDIPEDIQAFADMTLRELIEKFGTVTHFNDWLKATNEIEKINERRIKNAASEGELVSRELMKVGVIDPFNAAHRRMLTDGAKTIAVRASAMAKAGRSVEDVEKFVADQISSFIKPVKSRVARALRNA